MGHPSCFSSWDLDMDGCRRWCITALATDSWSRSSLRLSAAEQLSQAMLAYSFFCVVLAAAYSKYRRYRFSCLPFVWNVFIVTKHKAIERRNEQRYEFYHFLNSFYHFLNFGVASRKEYCARYVSVNVTSGQNWVTLFWVTLSAHKRE